MKERLSASKRRINILNFLVMNRQTTRGALAEDFSVSINTISHDIESLSYYIPIYTKSGNNGVVYILSEYRHYNHYLSDPMSWSAMVLLR